MNIPHGIRATEPVGGLWLDELALELECTCTFWIWEGNGTVFFVRLILMLLPDDENWGPEYGTELGCKAMSGPPP